MILENVMGELAAHGTAQNRKVYARHGYPETSFGVSFTQLRRLAKKIGKDHGLARALWQTSNGDARILATLIADPAAMSSEELDAWADEITWHVLADMFSALVVHCPLARHKCEEWRTSDKDLVSQAGWNMVALMAGDARNADLAWLASLIPEIEATIHSAGNRTRHAMNKALCEIGSHHRTLLEPALAAARRIGKVEVDHGSTGCKTPLAAQYIEKRAERFVKPHDGQPRALHEPDGTRKAAAAKAPVPAVAAAATPARRSARMKMRMKMKAKAKPKPKDGSNARKAIRKVGGKKIAIVVEQT